MKKSDQARRDAIRTRRWCLAHAAQALESFRAHETEIAALEAKLSILRYASIASAKNCIASATRAAKARRKADGATQLSGTSPIIDALESCALAALPPGRVNWQRERALVSSITRASLSTENVRRGKVK
jgi:hypothetical protein